MNDDDAFAPLDYLDQARAIVAVRSLELNTQLRVSMIKTLLELRDTLLQTAATFTNASETLTKRLQELNSRDKNDPGLQAECDALLHDAKVLQEHVDREHPKIKKLKGAVAILRWRVEDRIAEGSLRERRLRGTR